MHYRSKVANCNICLKNIIATTIYYVVREFYVALSSKYDSIFLEKETHFVYHCRGDIVCVDDSNRFRHLFSLKKGFTLLTLIIHNHFYLKKKEQQFCTGLRLKRSWYFADHSNNVMKKRLTSFIKDRATRIVYFK